MFPFEGRIQSRFILGTALYPSPEKMIDSIKAAESQIVTVSLRRQMVLPNNQNDFWQSIRELKIKVLPNTANCRSARQAVSTARAAREVFDTNWIKLEVIGDDYTLAPNPFELLEAATELVKDGFEVFPYTTYDYVVAHKLVEAGCRVIMPLAAPIGSGQGPVNLKALESLRMRLPDTTLICDAGIGAPSHAAKIMEIGFDGILLNTAVAQALDSVSMAKAFALAIEGGRMAYLAGLVGARDFAKPSTPVFGTPFANIVRQVKK